MEQVLLYLIVTAVLMFVIYWMRVLERLDWESMGGLLGEVVGGVVFIITAVFMPGVVALASIRAITSELAEIHPIYVAYIFFGAYLALMVVFSYLCLRIRTAADNHRLPVA